MTGTPWCCQLLSSHWVLTGDKLGIYSARFLQKLKEIKALLYFLLSWYDKKATDFSPFVLGVLRNGSGAQMCRKRGSCPGEGFPAAGYRMEMLPLASALPELGGNDSGCVGCLLPARHSAGAAPCFSSVLGTSWARAGPHWLLLCSLFSQADTKKCLKSLLILPLCSAGGEFHPESHDLGLG